MPVFMTVDAFPVLPGEEESWLIPAGRGQTGITRFSIQPLVAVDAWERPVGSFEFIAEAGVTLDVDGGGHEGVQVVAVEACAFPGDGGGSRVDAIMRIGMA